ncbi:PDZ domain-containing protein [Prosthecobacter sp.]|uniref:S41 family peptidase n=1 Tax=Prosthecobacter sp. TaxID=1965333 RepID=UPI002AB875A5|nr:PDZ domain-containing protein [Prosthecobacter sp.]MDZ4401713.1 PDZ domain-containing protein [Prosthecobacter sp.]
MKLHSLITTFVLGMTVLVHAQDKPVLQSAAAGVTKNPNPNPDGSMGLGAGTLVNIVAEIERRIPYWPREEGAEQSEMPNLVFAKETRDAVVPGDLVLRRVTPLQALTLAAAAADCMLEPIFSPAGEEDEGGGFGGASSDIKSPPIIGYRIVLASALNRGASPVAQQLAELARQLAAMHSSLGENHPSVVALRERIRHLEVESGEEPGALSGVGLVLSKKDDGIVVGQVVPGSPASLSPAIQPGQRLLSVAEAGKEDVDVTGLALEKVVQLVRGPPGTSVTITFGTDTDKGPTKQAISLVRANIPLPPSERMLTQVKAVDNNTVSFKPLIFNANAALAETPKENHRPFVKVYALGTIFTGNIQEIGEKQHRFENLVRDALGQSEPEGDVLSHDKSSAKAGASNGPFTAVKQAATQPEFSYHYETRALVVKATTAQHEIVEQVIKALKENAAQPAVPGR